MDKLNIDEIRKNAIVITRPDFSKIDGVYLRNFRIKFKMTQTILASYLGVSKKAIEKWEQGKNKVNPVVARMIYLMENDPKVFSLLKTITINGEIFDFGSINTNNNETTLDDDANTTMENSTWATKDLKTV